MNLNDMLLLSLVARTPSRYARQAEELMQLERAEILHGEIRMPEIRELRGRILDANTRYVQSSLIALIAAFSFLCLTALLL